jgi:predicted glycogen debranching enzyme
MDLTAEWLEADGLGGFASGTISGERTRRYHALLLAAMRPPSNRVVLVNGIEAWVDTEAGRYAISTQRYLPDVTYPEGWRSIVAFAHRPWPSWQFRLPDGTVIMQEVFVVRGGEGTVLRWRRTAGSGDCCLCVRPLLSGRDYHALHRENGAITFDSLVQGGNVSWRLYAGLPPISALSNGAYRAAPDWYRQFLYTAERDRGLDYVEDLASPGRFQFNMAWDEAVLMFRVGDGLAVSPAPLAETLAATERHRRDALPDELTAAANAFLADGAHGRTLVAGFPWFTDWGRDTFIALRGLLLTTGRLAEAETILAGWAGLVSAGMLPNRRSDVGDALDYNSVDAALWFVVAVDDFLREATETGHVVREGRRLAQAVAAILDGYEGGTRYGIGLDVDGLLRAGEPGVQLTWMDAKVGDRVITPRIGKPVEVEALWINALRIAQRWSPRWAEAEHTARAAFAARFPNPATGGLFDVVDADHVPGKTDARIRPNQIFAVGGLPYPVLDNAAARAVVDLVEAKLLTPLGLRSLAREDPDYVPRYRGGPQERDAAYHQGTVWPWLMGPFVEAWLRVRGHSAAAKSEARARFLPPLLQHLETAGLGHVSEVADGDLPHTSGGCPFQAWSLGELIRVRRLVCAASPAVSM